jgi:hypothetical protein
VPPLDTTGSAPGYTRLDTSDLETVPNAETVLEFYRVLAKVRKRCWANSAGQFQHMTQSLLHVMFLLSMTS